PPRIPPPPRPDPPTAPTAYGAHEPARQPPPAAAPLGPPFVERHITLDRAMWGSDQAASVEPQGLTRLVRDIRTIEESLGDGVKKVYESELGPMKKLRRVTGVVAEAEAEAAQDADAAADRAPAAV
ncbi:N-acetylneuraminate synthase family protein, partial [Streptomyces noursei]|uniref:N-acetylneuraminate synthase family protein n=1 Tax=Streptomyces noursei TaxID=1971 RepID=UPI000563E2C8